MAQSGYTPIILFNSGTTGHVPTTANLTLGELAINYTDGKIFYNNGSGSIVSFTPPVLAATSGTINGVSIGQTTSALGSFLGVTNGSSAASGNIGEIVTASGSSTQTATNNYNITSISLSAGNWEVWGSVSVSGSVTSILAGSNLSTGIAGYPKATGFSGSATINSYYAEIPRVPITLTSGSPTPIYGNCYIVVASGSVIMNITLYARRIY